MTWFDYLVRLLPGLAIVGGLVGARMQLQENRRNNAITIAKGYYRGLLEMFQYNTDILYGGTSEAAMLALEKDTANYRRYRLLFTNMSFAMQEIYFALDPKRNAHWHRTIRNFVLLFRYFIISETRFNATMRSTLDEGFLRYILQIAGEADHSIAADVNVLRDHATHPRTA